MDLTSSSNLLAICAVGVASVLLGLLGILLGTHRRATPRRMLTFAGLLLAGASGAWVLGAPSYLWFPGTTLAPVCLVFGISRGQWLPRTSGLLTTFLQHPRTQAALLLLGGIALLGWMGTRLDQNLDTSLGQSDTILAGLVAPLDLDPTGQTALTDGGESVNLCQPRGGAYTVPADEAHYLTNYNMNAKVIRTGAADGRYNCHGWVFAAGRFWVRGKDVERILKQNQYQTVPVPAVGDIAVYRSEKGDVVHTAIVRGVTERGLLLESKWGKLGRFVHTDAENVYSHLRCTWYHTNRTGGHTLRGLNYEPGLRGT